jgi:hypothetical protein
MGRRVLVSVLIATLAAHVALAESRQQSVATPPERVAGLLSLPEVFGNGPCDRFVAKDVPLHSSPEAPASGAIRVATPWTFPPEGGCQGLEVHARRPDSEAALALPVEEFEYESAGAVVLEQRGPWFRVRLADGSAWLRATERDRFHPLERLLKEGLTYLTSDWNGQLSSQPSGRGRKARAAGQAETSVRVSRSTWAHGGLWLYVEVMSHSGCEGGDEPRVVDRGWVPAQAPSGARVIWFYSRGC